MLTPFFAQALCWTLNHAATSRGNVTVGNRRKALKKPAEFRAQPIAGPGDSVEVEKWWHDG